MWKYPLVISLSVAMKTPVLLLPVLLLWLTACQTSAPGRQPAAQLKLDPVKQQSRAPNGMADTTLPDLIDALITVFGGSPAGHAQSPATAPKLAAVER